MLSDNILSDLAITLHKEFPLDSMGDKFCGCHRIELKEEGNIQLLIWSKGRAHFISMEIPDLHDFSRLITRIKRKIYYTNKKYFRDSYTNETTEVIGTKGNTL